MRSGAKLNRLPNCEAKATPRHCRALLVVAVKIPMEENA